MKPKTKVKRKPKFALWDVAVIERVYRRDGAHADPPGMLVRERKINEKHWLKIAHVEAFGLLGALKLARMLRMRKEVVG